MFFSRKVLIVVAAFIVALISVYADTASLLVLYTNDIHDYVKPGANGTGGLPYLSAYAAAMRAQRSDIVLLDGGDVMEKGDMVAFKTKSRVVYEAMGRMGYTAGAVGNHDIDHGAEHLNECAKLANYALLCLNHFDASGNLVFPPSLITEINNIRIGILGMTNIRTSIKEDGKRLAAAAKEMKGKTHLLIVTAHIGSRECAELAAMAPEVDLFVSAHTHEALHTPLVAPETGALIVQAGHYARYMGHLELVVDLEGKEIIQHEGKLVLMDHDTMAPDQEMLDWIAEVERQVCPEATEIVGKAAQFINAQNMGALAAAALREYGKADAAFCHSGRIIRSGLPPGDIDVNNLFRTGGQRGHELVAFTMTGSQMGAYLAGLVQKKRGKTEWAGFKSSLAYDSDTRLWTAITDLEPDRQYHVIMPKKEWHERFQRVAQEHVAFEGFDSDAVSEVNFNFTQALAAYARQITRQGETLDAHVNALLESRRP